MNWLEFHITTTAQNAEQLNNQLILLGAQSITFRDGGQQAIFSILPEKQFSLWDEVLVIALFDESDPIDAIGTYLEKQRSDGLLKKFELHALPDEDWHKRCLESFKPMRFGKRLWVCPSWTVPPDQDALNVVLDPGLAFGTGTHPTTALCLEWLDENLQAGSIVLDYGCGSGILALAAIKLGAKTVFAFDVDPQALESAEKNAITNKISDQKIIFGEPTEPVDVILANILAQPLIELAPILMNYLKPKGKIVLSGILSQQVSDVLSAYQGWIKFDLPVFRDEWALLSGIRLFH